MSPDDIEILKLVGQGIGAVLVGAGLLHGGQRIERGRSNGGWDENSDPDRRDVAQHTHKNGNGGGNGKPVPVPQKECDLRHELVQQKLDTIADGNTEIKRDIREINNQLRVG